MERVNWNQAVRPSTHDLIAAINSGADDIERIDGALDVIETALDGKAGVSGTYPDFVAGEALSIRSGIRSNTFLTHALDSDVADGIAEISRVLGNTVVWNQQCPALNDSSWSTDGSGVTKSYSNGVLTITFENSTGSGIRSARGPKMVNGHKYLMVFEARNNTYGTGIGMLLNGAVATRVLGTYANTSGSEWAKVSGIVTSSESVAYTYICLYASGSSAKTGSIEIRSDDESKPMCIDLTLMFGAGNEPQTVAEFEAQYGSDYKPYSAPVLLSSNIAGIEGASACEFASQTLRGIGTAQDVITRTGIERHIGIRDYASGDESDSSVRTDGTHTAYVLATPTTETFAEPIDLTYRVEAGGSEAWIVPDGTAPTSAAVTGEIAYPVNPSRALITHDSFADFIDKLGAYISATITETWDGSKYTYSFASGRSALLGSIEAEPDALEVTEKDDIVKEVIEDERKEL